VIVTGLKVMCRRKLGDEVSWQKEEKRREEK